MNTQQPLSPEMLVLLAPESFHALHLDDEGKGDEFDWDAEEPRSLFCAILDFFKRAA